MRIVLSALPVLVLVVVLAVALARRGRPTPWDGWPRVALLRFLFACLLIALGVTSLSDDVGSDALGAVVAVVGIAFVPVGLYVFVTGAYGRRDT